MIRVFGFGDWRKGEDTVGFRERERESVHTGRRKRVYL